MPGVHHRAIVVKKKNNAYNRYDTWMRGFVIVIDQFFGMFGRGRHPKQITRMARAGKPRCPEQNSPKEPTKTRHDITNNTWEWTAQNDFLVCPAHFDTIFDRILIYSEENQISMKTCLERHVDFAYKTLTKRGTRSSPTPLLQRFVYRCPFFLPAHQWMVFSYNVSVSVSVFRMDTRAPSSSCSERIIGPCRRQGVNKTRPPSSLTHHASTEQPPISVLSTKFASIN